MNNQIKIAIISFSSLVIIFSFFIFNKNSMHHYYREPGTTATIFVIKINDNYTIYSKQYKMFKSKYYIINKITGKTICTTDNSEQFKEQLIEKNIEVDLKKLTEFDWYLPPHQE